MGYEHDNISIIYTSSEKMDKPIEKRGNNRQRHDGRDSIRYRKYQKQSSIIKSLWTFKKKHNRIERTGIHK